VRLKKEKRKRRRANTPPVANQMENKTKKKIK
jgi:hypothetical protein